MVIYSIPKKSKEIKMIKSVTCVHCTRITLLDSDDVQLMERTARLHEQIDRLTASNLEMKNALEGTRHSTSVLNLVRQLLELTDKGQTL